MSTPLDSPVHTPNRRACVQIVSIVEVCRQYDGSTFPDKTVIKSAHANICRVQGDPSIPFKLGRALPGLDPWYQPYLSLLKQVGSHLNHFEPELRGNPFLIHPGLANGVHHSARLQLLVENAEIKIIQVPTLTENTGSQPGPFPPTEREFILCSASPSPVALSLGDNVHATPTGVKDNPNPTEASSQAAVMSNHIYQSGNAPPATTPEPPKKGRRRLNRAIFEVDTAAALRTKAQAGPSIAEATNPLFPEVTVQQEATGTVHPPNPLPEGPPEGALVEHAPDVGSSTEDQPQAQSEDVSSWDRRSTVSRLIRIGVH